METDLTIISVVENDIGLVDSMISSVCCFTDPMPKIILCDHGRNKDILEKYHCMSNIKIIKNKVELEERNTSVIHGMGLNRIFPLVDTKRTAIVEPDCAVLNYGWDLIPDGFKMVAAKRGDKDFYFICFMIFETDCLSGIDFSSDPQRKKQGFYADTGWKISDMVDKKDIYLMDVITSDTGRCKYFKKDYFTNKTLEFYRESSGPMASHFGRGSEIHRRKISKSGFTPAAQLFTWKGIVEQIMTEYIKTYKSDCRKLRQKF